jgi:transposase-like protein
MSFRDVEDLLYKRGVIVSYETLRSWVGEFGHQYAKVIRRDRPAPSDKWHLDEVVITIYGKKYWLWRAVDSKGDVLHILVQSRRNTKAADRFFRKLFKQYGQPRVLVTDKLGSWVHRNKGTRGPTRFENDVSLISSHEPTMPISQGSREICLSETVEPTCPSKELLPDTAQPALITLK